MVFGLRLVASILRLRWLTRRALPALADGDERLQSSLARGGHVTGTRVVVSSDIDRPLLWGWRIPTLLLPQSHSTWSDQDFELILSHEWAHAARGDHRSRIVMGLMHCIYWFHPVAWMLERLGGTLAEYAADDLCVSRGRSALSLGECLLRFASADPRSPSVSFASFRALRKRLKRLTFERSSSSQLQPVQRWLAPAVAIGFALTLSFSVGISDYTNATEASENLAAAERLEPQQQTLREAIAAMHSLSGWEHLPLDLEEQVLDQTNSGPEFNVDVRLVDEQGDPVMNALCAIVEDEYERTYRPGYLHMLSRTEELPLTLGVTDSNGGVVFRNVRGRQPSTNRNGIVGPVLVILHPEYGIRLSRLARSNRIQRVELALEAPVNIAGDVATEKGALIPGLPLLVSMFQGPIEQAAQLHEARFSSSILLPRPTTRSDGSYVLAGLPPRSEFRVAISPDSRHTTYQVLATPRNGPLFIPTQARNHDIVVKRSDRASLVFRCVDADRRETPPLPNAVGKPGQSSFTIDTDGNIVTRSYQSYGDGSGGMIHHVELQMPLPWMSIRHRRKAGDPDEPFEIAVKRGRIVRGKIIDAVTRAPLPGVDVWASPPSPEVLPNQRKWPENYMLAAGRTNRDGLFEFAITDAACSLYIDGPIYGYELPESMLGTGPIITKVWPPGYVIQAGQGDEEIVIALQPQPRLRGRVLDEKGQPAANALVSCWYRITERNESVATTNAHGEFELIPPPQGLSINPPPTENERRPFGYAPPPDDFTYQVSVETDLGRARQRLPEDWQTVANLPLEIQLQSRPKPRTLEGNVFLDGVGVPDFELGIGEGNRPPLESGSSYEMWQSVNNAIVARAKTDADGHYRIEIPGSEFGTAEFYILSFIPNGLLPPRSLPTPYIHKTQEETKVSLDGERNVGPDLKFLFKPGTLSIRGRVQSVDGKPFAGANLSLMPKKEEVDAIPLTQDVAPRERKTDSDADGRFEFKNLLPGEYRLQGRTPYTGSRWKLWVGSNCEAGDSEVILIMDERFVELPEKIVPQSIH
jgi:protocatechuate 3,4-dioxygenase beta subunit